MLDEDEDRDIQAMILGEAMAEEAEEAETAEADLEGEPDAEAGAGLNPKERKARRKFLEGARTPTARLNQPVELRKSANAEAAFHIVFRVKDAAAEAGVRTIEVLAREKLADRRHVDLSHVDRKQGVLKLASKGALRSRANHVRLAPKASVAMAATALSQRRFSRFPLPIF